LKKIVDANNARKLAEANKRKEEELARQAAEANRKLLEQRFKKAELKKTIDDASKSQDERA